MFLSFKSPSLGETINFQVCDCIGDWFEIGGIYMFCQVNRLGLSKNGLEQFKPVYIGQTNNFKNRLLHHEKWEESARLGAQKVLAVVESLQIKRDLLERQLIQYFDPPVNKQLRQPVRLGAFPPLKQAIALTSSNQPTGLGGLSR